MDAKYGEALSAFFDGEDVDGTLLAEALAQPGAHTLLAEYAAMRAKSQTGARPSPEFLDELAAKLRHEVHRLVWLRRFGRLALAACLVLVAGGVGYEWGALVERRAVPPAVPTRVPPQTASAQPAPLSVNAPPVAPSRPPAPRIRPQAIQPPVASLRLRLGQFRESPADAGGEGPRR